MSKSTPIGIRKPPSADLNAFVKGSGQQPDNPTTQPPSNPKVRAKGRGMKVRADGRLVRHLHLYLDPEVARRLEIAKVHTGRDMSDLANDLISEGLAKLGY